MDTDSQGVVDIGGFTHWVNAGFFIKHSLSVLISGSTAEIKINLAPRLCKFKLKVEIYINPVFLVFYD